MRRRTCGEPIEIQIRDDRPVRFRRGDREYEITAVLKMLALLRPREDVDTQLWLLRVRGGGQPEATCELRRDHGQWLLSAIWA